MVGREPSVGERVVEEIGLVLCSFGEGNSDRDRLVLEGAPRGSEAGGDGRGGWWDRRTDHGAAEGSGSPLKDAPPR